MSYDILVFTPSAVSDDGLSAWLTEQVEGVDGDSCDPAVTTPALRAFYEDMHQIFPPVNGPDRVDEEVLGDLPATDYSFGPTTSMSVSPGTAPPGPWRPRRPSPCVTRWP